jgi:cytochrome c
MRNSGRAAGFRLIQVNDGGMILPLCIDLETREVAMSHRWLHIILVAILVAIVIVVIRLHGAFGQAETYRPDPEQGQLYAQGWCTECHSVEPETAGTGKFAPDFTVIAKRRTAHWLNVFLRTEHKIMPDFVMKPDQSDDIVAYILSLKRR